MKRGEPVPGLTGPPATGSPPGRPPAVETGIVTDPPPVVAGSPDGALVVLLHGFPQSPVAWAGVMPALAAAGYRVVAPWLCGYGGGPAPADEELRLDAEADRVVSLADALGAERFHVVGHDWGALVAWRLAADAPGRVATLTALSVPHPRAMIAALPAGQALRSAYVALFRVPVAAEGLLGLGRGGPLRLILRRSGLPARFADGYVDHLANRDALGAALGWYRANGLRQLRGVEPAAVPTLLVWGRYDPAIGAAAVRSCRRFVTGPYRVEELDAGHWLPETQPDVVAGAVLAHLERHGGAPAEGVRRRR
jgi:pimeloyl-ACP methyl ester carboxylesterase